MKKRRRAAEVVWTPFREASTAELLDRVLGARKRAASALARAGGAHLRLHFAKRLFANNRYLVYWHEVESPDVGRVVRLGCLRRDGRPVHRWQDLQRIKNELLGPDARAVEVYPPRGELIDDVNMYHLWVWPSGAPCPFDLTLPPAQ